MIRFVKELLYKFKVLFIIRFDFNELVYDIISNDIKQKNISIFSFLYKNQDSEL